MIYPILPDRHPILHNRVPDFDFAMPAISPPVLVADLFETLEAHNAVGLAANQCGLPFRVFVLRSDALQTACFNPTITQADITDEIKLAEGCLSFPGLSLEVKRPAMIRIAYQDVEGRPQEALWGGWTARIAQHEQDHLDGMVFTSRVSKLRLDMARKKLGKV